MSEICPPGSTHSYANPLFSQTQDHGPVNTWNRAMYENVDGSTEPAWTYITNNFIMNGPSGNRDLGNLFPCIDNDDGSAFFLIEGNVCVYGGGKNFLGNDKIWRNNLFAFPGRWSGDPCLQAWGGVNNLFTGNVCYQNGTSYPLGLDGSVRGKECVVDYDGGEGALEFVANTTNNTYWVAGGDERRMFSCGDGKGDGDRVFGLKEMQGAGFEVGTVVEDLESVGEEELVEGILEEARELLSR